MHTQRRRSTRASFTGLALTLLLGLAGALPASAATDPGTAPDAAAEVAADLSTQETTATAMDASATDITFTGNGYGHGRGMGQYGARGYAVAYGWDYRQILGHFYSNTVVGSVGNPVIDVHLELHKGSFVVIAGNNLRYNGIDVAGAGLDVVKVARQGPGVYDVYQGATCDSASWTLLGTVGNNVELTVPDQTSVDNLIRACESGYTQRAYRGSILVRDDPRPPVTPGGPARPAVVVNRVATEAYLRGVVPRESPAAWGKESNGMAALRAQAVAARSYALASTWPAGTQTCDTTSCQVYGGAALYTYVNGAYAKKDSYDVETTDNAIAQTAGEVRFKSGTTTIARTEFSASTGGWTAGGAFPAVQDLGDAVSNPYHPWTASYSVAEVAAKLGISGVRSIVVTGRNGLGEWGGRVTSVAVVDGSGVSHTYSGTTFRSTMGTTTFRSDWFVVAWTSPAEAEAVVKALYQDLLGRAPDPTGLQGWSSALMQGTSQSALVASLTRSDEYIWLRVTKAYREVLGREPDPVGATSWLNAIKAGQATVDDVQRRFYDSTEYYLASGGTTEGYVKRLYTTMLRRPASAAEVTSWVSLFNQKGRAWVVDAIWFSLEAASVRAGDYYGTFLGRAPDPAGQAAWAQVLLQYGEGAVRVGIAGSLEYRARAIARFP